MIRFKKRKLIKLKQRFNALLIDYLNKWNTIIIHYFYKSIVKTTWTLGQDLYLSLYFLNKNYLPILKMYISPKYIYN